MHFTLRTAGQKEAKKGDPMTPNEVFQQLVAKGEYKIPEKPAEQPVPEVKLPPIKGKRKLPVKARAKKIATVTAKAQVEPQTPTPTPQPPTGGTLQYGDMILSVELITPEIATSLLSRNNSNRTLRRRTVEQYARDMAAGKWHRKPVAICITPDGQIGNGQHTLHAIVMSGVAQQCLVSINTPADAITSMDTGLRRTISDLAKFAGLNIGTRDAAITRIVAFGITDSEARSFDELFEAYQFYQEAIDWCVATCSSAVNFNSASMGVLAAAWYTADRDKLNTFTNILKNGTSTGHPEDRTVILLRDYLQRIKAKGGVTRSTKVEQYYKTQTALSAYLDGRPLTRLYATENDKRFPVPQMPEAPSFAAPAAGIQAALMAAQAEAEGQEGSEVTE